MVSILALWLPALEPVKAHVHRFNAPGDDGGVCDSDSGGVVCLDERLRLRPIHCVEGVA